MGFFDRGIRNVALSKKALSSSAESERSIAESGMVESRSQSVPECFLESVAFMPGRLSYGNEPDLVSFVVLGEDNDRDDSLEETDTDPSFFAVVFTVIDTGEHGIVEHPDGILEGDCMPGDVPTVFRFVPCVPHRVYIHYVCTHGKRSPGPTREGKNAPKSPKGGFPG